MYNSDANDADPVTEYIECIYSDPDSELAQIAANNLARFYVTRITRILAPRIPFKHSAVVEPGGLADQSIVDSITELKKKKQHPRTEGEFFAMTIRIAKRNMLDELKSETSQRRGGKTIKQSIAQCRESIVDPHMESDLALVIDLEVLLQECLTRLPTDLHRRIWRMRLDGMSSIDNNSDEHAGVELC